MMVHTPDQQLFEAKLMHSSDFSGYHDHPDHVIIEQFMTWCRNLLLKTIQNKQNKS